MAEIKMNCPLCNSNDLTLKYEASYVYSYVIDHNAPGLKNSDEFLSYQYDSREQKDHRSYIECGNCKTQYPSDLFHQLTHHDNHRNTMT